MGARHLRREHQREQRRATISSPNVADYPQFDHLDGQHPWMQAVPDGFVPYQVRELKTGEISYFNYVLAKEMGLIASNHPHKMTETLKTKLIETFSIQIINEYDELTKRRIDPSTIKPHKYMASRYLQLQHSNRQGKTSGDGRGIWNGTVSSRGKTWDVSSRGTGVTCLAPGAVEANRPLKTGTAEFGYGCGQAEIDELYGAAILAEIMHLQGIPTERVLCIIELGKGYGIGVRAAPNLLRPAHMFLYLKQSRYKDLKASADYFIERQSKNSAWKLRAKGPAKYEEMAEQVCESFSKFTAQLDIDYIFAWLDWDGDNVLADSGIIDYGSVRQFGIRHDQYRYDDIERFSTNLNEQRLKAKLMVQVFVQMADYLKTHKKKPLKYFSKHPTILKFNKRFQYHRAHRLLYRMGFNKIQRENILKAGDLFEMFDKEYTYFERAKISGTKTKVADGINHPALFNMRSLMKFLPKYLMEKGFESQVPDEQVFKVMLSSFAKFRDTKMRTKHRGHVQNLQRLYKLLLEKASGSQKTAQILRGVSERAQQLNTDRRITGNALIQIVFEIMDQIKKGMNFSEVQMIIDQLISTYQGMPEVEASRFYDQKPKLVAKPDLFSKILGHVENHREDI